MRACATIRTQGGATYELGHGDLIGRLRSATLCVDDARVSEAHAMVSLRGTELKLLALRGMFAIDGKPIAEVVLRAGLVVELARGLAVEVVSVNLPREVLGIEADGLGRQVLSAGVCSLIGGPRPMLRPRFQSGAAAYLWSNGAEWRLQIGDRPAQPLDVGTTWTIGGRRFEAVAIPLGSAGQGATHVGGSVRSPLHIVAHFDTVHIHRDGEPSLALSGIGARILSELVALDGPVVWHIVAAEIWDEPDRDRLRKKWDVNLARLRRKLADARVRSDLLRADGTGHLDLLLYPDDRVDNCT